MINDYKHKIALFKYGLIAPIINNTFEDDSKHAYFTKISKEVKKDFEGQDFKVSITTLRDWVKNYQNKGLDGLIPTIRNDAGRFRALDEDLKNKIRHYKDNYPRIQSTLIYEKLISDGDITKEDVSLSTITRFVNQIKKESKETVKKEMRRYEREHINEVWCGDSSHGPYLTIKGIKHKVYIIALLDDASRFIVGIDVFLNDNYANLLQVIRSAVHKYGKPKFFNFDNGSNYKNTQIAMMAARLGSVIKHCEPYTPQSKAKIERWFRTLKDKWMGTINYSDFHNLDELRVSLLNYVNEYNNTVHSSLKSLTPSLRFFSEADQIIRINPDDDNKIFLMELERKVSSDNVIVIDNIEYEVPYRYCKQRVTLRFNHDLSSVYIVDGSDFVPIQLLNKVENSQIKREKIRLSSMEEN